MWISRFVYPFTSCHDFDYYEWCWCGHSRGCMLLFLLNNFLRANCWILWLPTCLIFSEAAKLFFQSGRVMLQPASNVWGFRFFHILRLVWSFGLYPFQWVFICFSLITKNELFFQCTPSLVKCVFKLFADYLFIPSPEKGCSMEIRIIFCYFLEPQMLARYMI